MIAVMCRLWMSRFGNIGRECGRIILSSHSRRWKKPCLKPFRREHSTYLVHLNHVISELICKSLAEQEELVAGLTVNSLLCLMRPCCRCVNCTKPWNERRSHRRSRAKGDVTLIPKSPGGYWSRRSPAHYGRLHHASHVGGGEIESGSFLSGKRTSLVHARACRPANAVPDLIIPIELTLDECAQEHSMAHGTSYDLAKAFDTMPFGTGGLGWICSKERDVLCRSLM